MEIKCVNFAKPVSAALKSGNPGVGAGLAAFFNTRKYISKVASNNRLCIFFFSPKLITAEPSSKSR